MLDYIRITSIISTCQMGLFMIVAVTSDDTSSHHKQPHLTSAYYPSNTYVI
jgi:hypothetical protein